MGLISKITLIVIKALSGFLIIVQTGYTLNRACYLLRLYKKLTIPLYYNRNFLVTLPGKPQENPGKTPGKPWENPGKTPGKPQENIFTFLHSPGKPRENILTFLHSYIPTFQFLGLCKNTKEGLLYYKYTPMSVF